MIKAVFITSLVVFVFGAYILLHLLQNSKDSSGMKFLVLQHSFLIPFVVFGIAIYLPTLAYRKAIEDNNIIRVCNFLLAVEMLMVLSGIYLLLT